VKDNSALSLAPILKSQLDVVVKFVEHPSERLEGQVSTAAKTLANFGQRDSKSIR